MSSGRTIKRTIDIDLMEATAQRLGYKTERLTGVMGYYTDVAIQGMDRVPLVIHDKNSHYDVGFNGQSILADFHGGYVDHMLEELLPEYQRTQFEKNYVMVDRVINMPDRIRMVVRR